MVEAIDRAALGQIMAASGRGLTDEAVDEYFKAFSTPEGRAGVLEMYRSGEFSKLESERGKLAELDVPTLLIWGEDDEFAPVAGAHRFKQEIPHAELVVVEGAGHFVWSDAAQRCRQALLDFLSPSAAPGGADG